MKSMTVVRPALNKLKGSSDQSVSTDLRVQGDLLFADGKLFEALECYNKSLCAAQLHSHDIPLAYDGRSVVYFEAKEYQLCLDNIELALHNGNNFCNDVGTLMNRKEKCLKLIASHQRGVDDDPWNFFKLSYPANEKIPFIVDCVQLHNNKKYGRFIITTQG